MHECITLSMVPKDGGPVRHARLGSRGGMTAHATKRTMKIAPAGDTRPACKPAPVGLGS